ncbi:molybdopterin-guanine dinucleotide biosynthesis protein [Cryobacterium sinapicolor]|uniref:Molybdopterin-guanine dinucleotide biosynthesis protein n=1 Tax=Cryobacterium sinapicolor TaxID=1259236 RepID=A0ABY2JG96_9MICO|nr:MULTISPECIES: NTP transferase domain-containing protein [Cryobacterium]TFC91537.1 molybdopterin-guanine dinucleotide biosynthesis protein [Cryobacterium sp. TMT3-29-2]TFD05055.1 molybdopterin-guanine dinucleotide biosynthesis protein [Cryobacterium sinapicolor]
MTTESARVDLIVLAGGRARRLDGAVKPAIEVAGRTLLSRVLDARGLARHVVVVGPVEARAAVPADATADLTWTLEDPPFGGPVAGIVAGLGALERVTAAREASAPPGWVLLLACDLPWAADAARLLVPAATDPGLPASVHGLHLVDPGGSAQWLAGIYRLAPLRAAAHRLGADAHGASMHGLLATLTLRGVRDLAGAGSDVDTWQDVERSSALLTSTPQRDDPTAEQSDRGAIRPRSNPMRSDTE